MKQTFSILTVLIILSLSLSSYGKRKPKWITERPIDKEFYIGIGKAIKKQNPDYLQTAKSNALADMISEISVKISTNSILTQLEDNNGLKERYQANIRLAAKDDISDFEMVDSWENKDEYWVYYRLSKAEYQKRKKERLDKAKNLSKDFFEKAKSAEAEYDINNAINYYIKAFEAIEKYLGEDLSVFTLDGSVILDNEIYQSVNDILSRIKVVPTQESFMIKSLSSGNEPVIVKVKLKTELETQNLANVPVVFSNSESDNSRTERVLTSSTGIAECTKVNMIPKGRNVKIKAEFDINSYFQSENLLKQLLTKNIIPPYNYINIEVKELFAYLESEETIFGNQNSVQAITQIFKEELSSSYFSFVDNEKDAEVRIKIESKIRKGTKLDKHNLHTAFLNCSVSIIDVKNNLTIFNDAINIRGMNAGSFEAAAKDAVKKARIKIKTETIPSIRKLEI